MSSRNSSVPPAGVLISDGGLATELEARGHDLSDDDLWSARLLRRGPDEIVAVHEAFFRAGAHIATTASYQASFEGFAAQGSTARGRAADAPQRRVGQVRPGRRVGPGMGGGLRRFYGRCSPTVRSTSAATGSALPSWRRGTGRGWRC